MPYINIHVSVQLDDDQKNSLKTKLGELITIIPGKSESVLMIGIQDGMSIYFAGEKKERVAFIDVRVYGPAPAPEKAAFTREIFALFSEDLAISGDNLFMTFTESDNWGFKGEYGSIR